MFAVIKTGGKQYRVSLGKCLSIEKLDVEVGQSVHFKEVLIAETEDGKTWLGQPLLDDAHVVAKVLKQDREKKIHIIKFRRRKSSKTQSGHRQSYTRVMVTSIHLGQGVSVTLEDTRPQTEKVSKPDEKTVQLDESNPKQTISRSPNKKTKPVEKNPVNTVSHKKEAPKKKKTDTATKKAPSAKTKKTADEKNPSDQPKKVAKKTSVKTSKAQKE